MKLERSKAIEITYREERIARISAQLQALQMQGEQLSGELGQTRSELVDLYKVEGLDYTQHYIVPDERYGRGPDGVPVPVGTVTMRGKATLYEPPPPEVKLSAKDEQKVLEMIRTEAEQPKSNGHSLIER